MHVLGGLFGIFSVVCCFLLVMFFLCGVFGLVGVFFFHVHALGCLFLPVRADADTTFYFPIGVDVFVFYYHCLQLLLLSFGFFT